MAAAVHCRPEAYALFAAAVAELPAVRGLLHAAVAIAKHELADADATAVEHELRTIAETIRKRVRGPSPSALLAHAHQHLFDELRLRGNAADYYDPGNSYLPVVLRTKLGIPISLSLVYSVVLEQLGVQVEGINAPGHFLVRVQLPAQQPMLVDPFDRGRIVTEAEALRRTGAQAATALQVATPAAWLRRWLGNLHAIFRRRGQATDGAAMVELSSLLA